MAISPITVVIDPPLPTDPPATFDTKAFAAWAALNPWAAQANTLAQQVEDTVADLNDPAVQQVADNIADVIAVGQNIGSVNSTSANMAAIIAAPGYASTASNSAAAASNSAASALDSKNSAQAAAAAAQSAAGLPSLVGNANKVMAVSGDERNALWTPLKTINGQSIVGEGNLIISPETGLIGTPGAQGFGVGIYPYTLPDGFSPLSGFNDPANGNYGNYQYSDGSIAVFIPRFFYRIGHPDSPRYSVYGNNAVDIADVNRFSTIQAANAAGYALHRAFINGGKVLSGFFFDKYISSRNGDSACKSVFGGIPISLSDSTEYITSVGMVTPDGILSGYVSDAISLSRSRGEGWHCESVFQRAAIALLSIAHGQASTSTTYCAWYSAGATNFPKGCNNSLSDINDSSVTYASAGEAGSSLKPKTGATAGFNKTTHNGQASGVADMNGTMWQMIIGMTYHGTSITSSYTPAIGADYQVAFVLKESTDISTLTWGFGTATGGKETFGTRTHLLTLYDEVSGFYPWQNALDTRFGNAENKVFDSTPTGIGRLKTSAGIPLSVDSCSTSGTNLFGADQMNGYNRANIMFRSGGGWSLGSQAGVNTLNGNSGVVFRGQMYGFRSAFYGE